MLSGKTAIITGASRGIGEAVAYKFAENHADIAVIYAGNSEMAEAVCQNCIKNYNVKAKAYQCDVSDFKKVKEVIGKIKADFSNIQILVNNAGITKDNLLAFMSEDDFDSVISTNLKGAFNMIRHVSPIFMKNRAGSIINISSVVGIMGNAGQCNYSASKAGIIGLTKSAAKELAPRNIKCNAIAPGFIETDMTKSQTENPFLKMIPLGEMGKPEYIAETALFLALSKYITGEVIKVDGGLAM